MKAYLRLAIISLALAVISSFVVVRSFCAETLNSPDAAAKIVKQDTGVKAQIKEVKQKIGLVNNDPCRISLTVSSTDDKGKTTDEIYEFTLTDMNKALVDLKVSGKKIEVTIPCKNKEKLVKVYKNGEQQAWGSEAKLEEADVETARNVAEAFRSVITQCEK